MKRRRAAKKVVRYGAGDAGTGAFRGAGAETLPVRETAKRYAVRSQFEKSLDRGIKRNFDALKALADW